MKRLADLHESDIENSFGKFLRRLQREENSYYEVFNDKQTVFINLLINFVRSNRDDHVKKIEESKKSTKENYKALSKIRQTIMSYPAYENTLSINSKDLPKRITLSFNNRKDQTVIITQPYVIWELFKCMEEFTQQTAGSYERYKKENEADTQSWQVSLLHITVRYALAHVFPDSIGRYAVWPGQPGKLSTKLAKVLTSYFKCMGLDYKYTYFQKICREMYAGSK